MLLEGEDLADLSPEERAHQGIFLSFQYPIEIPGVSVTNFIKTAINATRKAKGLEDMPANVMLKKIREKSALLEIDSRFLSRSLNEGFSGGEKKRCELFQLALSNPNIAMLDEIDSGLDIDSLKVISKGISEYSNEGNAMLIITHYQRLLDYVVPDEVHIFDQGKIIKSGNSDLVKVLEEKGYKEFN